MSESVSKVLREIQTWENAPVNELLGTVSTSRDNVTKRIIMYGQTQMGKTTLIMDLIGIAPEKQKELEKILRGGASRGRSSTSTAIIYSRWQNEDFGLALGSIHQKPDAPELFDAEGFKKRIAEINEKNRSEENFGKRINKKGSILYYYLPDSYFDEDADTYSLQIVDLPGFGENNSLMKAETDEMIGYFSTVVAGAIVVVKSENIAKLGAEYREFIEDHHQNHLAVAVSYALKTSEKLEGLCTNKDSGFICEGDTDRSIAIKLSEHYRDLIAAGNYMTFDKDITEQIVFPVEQGKYIRESKKFSFLEGAFDESRALLKERIARMKNRTSIDACIDELDVRNKNLKKKNQQLSADLAKYEKELKVYEKTLASTEEKLNASKIKYDTAVNALEDYKKTADALISALDYLDDKLVLSPSVGLDIIEETHFERERRQSLLCTKMSDGVFRKLNIGLEDENASLICESGCEDDLPRSQMDLYKTVADTANSKVQNFDYNHYIKHKDGPFFRTMRKDRWDSYARFSVKLLSSMISQDGKENIENERKKKERELLSECSRKKEEYTTYLEGMTSLSENYSRLDNNITLCKDSVSSNEKQIESNTKRRESVKGVFVKCFKEKKAELCDRIEKEPSPEIKTATFIALSAIYMNMKPYLEE